MLTRRNFSQVIVTAVLLVLATASNLCAQSDDELPASSSPVRGQVEQARHLSPASGGSGMVLPDAFARLGVISEDERAPATANTLGGIASSRGFSTKGSGPNITAPGSFNVPSIDGFVDSIEWTDALSIDISILSSSVLMYLKHDGDFLYVAVEDRNDRTLDALDQIALYFDDEGGSPPNLNDNAWSAISCPGNEGTFWLGNFPAWPDGDGYRGIVSDATYDYIFCDPLWGGTNVEIAFGLHGGSMHYEAAIDLSRSELQAEPGDTLGWYVLSFDEYVVGDPDPYAQVTGRWPELADYQNPSQYGNLTLGLFVPTPDQLNVANLDHSEVFFFCDAAVKPPLTIYEDYGLWWRNVVDGMPGEIGYQYQGYPWDSCTGTPPFDFEFPAPSSNWIGVQFTPTGLGTACYRARSWQDDGGKAYSDWSPCCCMDVVEAACTTLGTPTLTGVGDTTCGGATADTTPELNWSDVRDEDGYRWQVRNTAGTVVDSGVTATNQTFATVDELEPGSYTVRVQAQGDGVTYCDGDWSSQCSFEVYVSCTSLSTPTVSAVGDTTCGGTTTDTTPELHWSDVSDEDGYRWQVRNTAGTVVDSGETATDQTFATVDELEPGSYTVRVQAQGDGQTYCDSDWSADCPFTVEAGVQHFADFTWWPEQPKQGEAVRFANVSSDGSTSWHWDFGDGGSSIKQHATHVFESSGSFRVLLDVEFDSEHFFQEKPITVSGVVQCGDGACEGTETAWSCPADCALELEETGRAGGTSFRPTMPAAAGGVSGAGGTLWRTQATVHNPGSETVTFVVEFTPRNKTLILQAGPFELKPGHSRYWGNIIEELFNRTGSGGLWVDASAPVLFLTRTYTENPDKKKTTEGGTFGEGRYGTRGAFPVGLGDGEVYLIGLQHDDRFRSNLYFQEVDGSDVQLEVEIFDSSGQRLQRRLVDVDGHSSKLRSLKDLGADGVHSAYATVEVAEGNGRVAAGGSVIDNITGDPTALDAVHPDQVAKKSSSEQHFLVAAVAHTTGIKSSVWRSGLTILNPTSVSQTVTLRFEVEYDRTGAIGEFLEESMTIPAGHQKSWEDVLVDLFEAPENAKTQGALHVFSQDTLMINSRTYNERSDGGTFGLGLPGLKSGDLISTDGKGGIMEGLIHSDGTRTNIGLSEYSGQETEVEVTFSGTQWAIRPLNPEDPLESTVPANSHFQFLKVFEKIPYLLGREMEAIEARVVVKSGGLVYSYATTIDNDSGDPTAFTTVKE